MSLLEDSYEPFTIINKTTIEDGYGSVQPAYTDGPTIQASIDYNSSLQTEIAKASGVTALYTLTTHKNIILDFHTILRRKSDNRIFRITSNSNDDVTPDSSALDMRQYSAEEYNLPPT